MFPLMLAAALATAPVALPVNAPAASHVDPMETRDHRAAGNLFDDLYGGHRSTDTFQKDLYGGHRSAGNLQDDLYGGRRAVTSFEDALILGDQHRSGINPDDVGHRADRRSVGNLPDDPMNDRGHRVVFSDQSDRPFWNGGSF